MIDKINQIKEILSKLDCFLDGKDTPVEYRFYLQDIEALLQEMELMSNSKPMIVQDYVDWHKYYLKDQNERNK